MKRILSCIFLVVCLSSMIPTTKATAVYYKSIPLSEEVQTYLYNQCVCNDIDFDLMLALIEQESEFDKYSTSPTGDYGLCQINIEANAELIETKKIYNVYDEYHNIGLAITILSELQEKYGKDVDCVLMCYNMGEDGAKRLWDKGIWESKYSMSIKRKMCKYNKYIKMQNRYYIEGN